MGSLIAFAVAGVGITLLPDFLVRGEAERGDLLQLTRDEDAAPTEVFAVTAEGKRTRSVETLLERLTSDV